jgi:hypothetical protein
MNFLCEPAHAIHPNSVMDDDQLSVATQFVNELLDIGALGTPLSLDSVLTMTPLFVSPSPTKNLACGRSLLMGSDPVYFATYWPYSG